MNARRTLLLILLFLAGLFISTFAQEAPKPKTKPFLIAAPLLSDVVFTIALEKTTIEIHNDGRVTWTAGTLQEAAETFWREVAKITGTFAPTERIQAVTALETALSHLRLSTEEHMRAEFLVHHSPCPACDLKAQAAAIEQRDADIKDMTETLDRLRNRKEQ